ncbi:beta-L-arabinofuranosidase domain-containing protein [Butyrivibrio sp. FCS014]|uniref:beta-L-arabinofuranosidase domain-containing protein n=1 Tax=Butyrivibrio sp. FCS014 TaxID=1408304 RepID=UPI00046669C7|nr:beta-L-arabinofuranosidase domain-containing protein [Butyrivibrio sp. FCS014]
MSRNIEIYIDKLYRYDRKNEHCYIGFPLERGVVWDADSISVKDPAKETYLPVQVKATSRYDDGSFRFVFIRFLADIPANKKSTYICEIASGKETVTEPKECAACDPLCLKKTEDGFEISSVDDSTRRTICYRVKDNSDSVFSSVFFGEKTYEGSCFSGPSLKKKDEEGSFDIETGNWEIAEEGPLCVILKNRGIHKNADSDRIYSFELRLTFAAGKPYAEVSYRIINDTDDPLEIGELEFRINTNGTVAANKESVATTERSLDSTGCGDKLSFEGFGEGPLFHAGSSEEADKICNGVNLGKVRAVTASSNYKTDYFIGKEGASSARVIDSGWLMKEANEHFAEVFYGTFFADYTDDEGGICATIFQAQQNYPKAVSAGASGIALFLVPKDTERIVLQSGMSREQKFLLHFHDKDETLSSLNDRSIVYQMPYRPYVSPEVHRRAGVWPDVFAKKGDFKVEQNLIARADGHCRAYGMLNFGDSYDPNYTAQGRGGGRLVWCNNEYDYPHACALLYARTGIRRFMDYNIASACHWMDVDVCHYHKDPLYIGGQWEHTAGHVVNGTMVCSHEWVEGLLDYYHLTGDERGLETAIGIGRNVNRLLDMPMYAKAGETNARETGWALRTLTALYIETGDKNWLVKCKKILDDFKIWEEQYGHWLAPYTDNTVIRVGFMISVAVGSLMRYYRQFPDEELKGLILRAVDDMIENCYVKEWGIFYYKELPSLNRLGNNTLLLEALTIAYDLTKDPSYLDYGMETFRKAVADTPGYSGTKRKEEDAVLVGNTSSKNFAQSMIPVAGFYRAMIEAGKTL